MNPPRVPDRVLLWCRTSQERICVPAFVKHTMLKIPGRPSGCEPILMVFGEYVNKALLAILSQSSAQKKAQCGVQILQPNASYLQLNPTLTRSLSCPPLAVVEILQSLHSLQQENQRLQDQILGLTAKKERLQLLNTELAVPFPPHALSSQGSVHASAHAQINFLSPIQGLIFQSYTVLQRCSILPPGAFLGLSLIASSRGSLAPLKAQRCHQPG